MSAFVYYTATSVNGYIADENSSLQWLFDVGGDGAEDAAAFIAGVGVQVMGSSTYEWLLTNEHLLATPEKWQQVFGDIPTRVFTTRDLPRPETAAFEFRRGAWLVDGGLHYSISTNQYVALPRVGPQTLPVANLTGLSLDLRRSSLRDVDWQVTQTGGRDFADPANFINPRIGDDMRFAEGEIQQANLNARFTPAWSLPAWFKVGVKATEQYHRFRNPNSFLTWRYDGPGGGPTGSFASLAYPQNAWQLENGVRIASLSGGVPVFANRTELGRRFRESPEQFTPLATPANFFTAFIDTPSYVKETLRAAYALAHARVRGLQLQAGLRGEDTGFASREFDARTAAEVRAAGFTVTPANGRATTVPGLTYQYMSRPKTTRRSGYTHLFPSASAKYSFTENLQADGRFKPAAQLRAEFERLLAGRDPAQVVHQCGSGVSAVPNLLAMEIAGLGRAKLYPGSWSEWCNTPGLPTAQG